MWSDLELTWTVTLAEPHAVRICNVGGFFTDRFEVWVDGQRILRKQIGCGNGSHTFLLEGESLELRWILSHLSGTLTCVALLLGEDVLARHGTDKIPGLKRAAPGD